MKAVRFLALVITFVVAACTLDSVPVGAGLTPNGDGPLIVFDILRRPLPEIPQPNDVATTPDPTSRTGRRLNVSLNATSRLESVAREGFDDMEGWGTFQPITVAFERPRDVPEGSPAIDLARLAGHMQHDGHDFSDDPVYLVNLTTGVPVPLEMGVGDFPTSVIDKTKYFPNDPRGDEENLLFETADEAQGRLPSQYDPALDTDFDGVLDRPNTDGPVPPGGIANIDNLVTYYERESDTLILRPLLPLEEKTEYAVVLTDRLKDPNGRPVRSPFEYIHHATQKREALRVGDILNDKNVAPYFGDLAGSGLAHVAFAWSFTTQPVMEDMRLIRDGLYGRGPLGYLAHDYPVDTTAFRAIGTVSGGIPDPVNWQGTSECTGRTDRLYIVRVDQAKSTLDQFIRMVLGLSGPEADRLEQSLDNVDHFVIGEFNSPYFMGDPTHEDPDGRFRINYQTGEAHVQPDTVPFWLSVPKVVSGHAQPFPTTVWAHGSGNNGAEILVRAGYFAKQGVAMLGIDLPGHGLVLDNGLASLAKVFLASTCMVPWLDGIQAGRAYDLNGDGKADSGGLLWSAHIFHSRDNIRQGVVDLMQATRVIGSWDGFRMSAQDYDGDGQPNVAGDFDGNGTPDVGAGADVYAAGNSLGGVLALIHGSVDASIRATASISGGGGLTDIATRSTFVAESVMEQVLSPLVVAVPGSSHTQSGTGRDTQCQGDTRSVRFVVNDLTDSREIEIACLTPAELGENMTILLTNTRNKETRCARAGADGRFRIPMPASVGDSLHLEIFAEKDVVESYASCTLRAGATLVRAIDTFEQGAVTTTSVPEDAPSCDDTNASLGLDEGTACAQFQGHFFPVGSGLVAPQEGLGLRRQTPDFRRLISLTQAAIDPSDPVNFAPYYYRRALAAPDGSDRGPRAVMEFNTNGDPLVPTATGYSFGRSLGAVPIFAPDVGAKYPAYADYTAPVALYAALGGKTPDDMLRQYHAIEGLPRLGRTSAGPACKANRVPASATCPGGPTDMSMCSKALPDVDDLAEGAYNFDAEVPPIPARLARLATTATDAVTVDASWLPRIVGAPFKADPANPTALFTPMAGVVTAYNEPLGEHVWVDGDPCKQFDDAVYYDHLLIRFLATRGTDVYFLSHPGSHRCLEKESCAFFTQTN